MNLLCQNFVFSFFLATFLYSLNAQANEYPYCDDYWLSQGHRVPVGQICETSRTSGMYKWQLYKRSKTNKMVWKDLVTGLLWSSPANMTMNYYEAKKGCVKNDNADTLDARAGITNKKFRLPTLQEFELAQTHGLWGVSPGILGPLSTVITSSNDESRPGNYYFVREFWVGDVNSGDGNSVAYGVRCVTQDNL